MTNSVSKPSALIRLAQVSNNVLDSPHLTSLKNIVFVLVLLNYWSKAYNKVLVGGPVRAFNDLKAYIIKVSISLYRI
jgi:sphinganine-1-phosphate aldolase